jgi:hypothetical protein
MRKLNNEQIQEVCQRYQDGEPTTSIAEDFNVSATAINGLLTRRGIIIRPQAEAQRRFLCDHTFFSSIDTEEKAYWLGFIAADGYISPVKDGKNALVVVLAPEDRDHLYRLRNSLQSTHPVKEYNYSYKQLVKLFIRSEQITCDLARYSIVPAKTFTHVWPNLPDDLLIHFVRGYVDGDGGFHRTVDHRRPNKPNFTFEITSNRPFLEACQRFLMRTCDLPQTKFDQRRPPVPIFTMRYGGNLQVTRIGKVLYEHATICLPRKYALAMSL